MLTKLGVILTCFSLVLVAVLIAVQRPAEDTVYALAGSEPIRAEIEALKEASTLDAAFQAERERELAVERQEARNLWIWNYTEKENARIEAERIEAERRAAERRAAEQRERERREAQAAQRAAAAPRQQAAPQVRRSGSCGGWEGLIASYFPSEVDRACRVMMCESGGNPTAQNPRSTASGLFQFLDSTWRSTTGRSDRAYQASPAEQVAAAAKLRASSGWSPWVCK